MDTTNKIKVKLPERLNDAVKIPENWGATVNFSHLKTLIIEDLTIRGEVEGNQDFTAHSNLKNLTFSDATNIGNIRTAGPIARISAPNATRVGDVASAIETYFPNATHISAQTFRRYEYMDTSKIVEITGGSAGAFEDSAPETLNFPNLESTATLDFAGVKDLIAPKLMEIHEGALVGNEIIYLGIPNYTGNINPILGYAENRWIDAPKAEYNSPDGSYYSHYNGIAHIKTTVAHSSLYREGLGRRTVFYVPGDEYSEVAGIKEYAHVYKPYSEWEPGVVPAVEWRELPRPYP